MGTHANDKRIMILVLGEYRAGKSSIVDILLRRDAEQIRWEEAYPSNTIIIRT